MSFQIDDLISIMKERRSTRSFTDEQILPGELDVLLEMATWAPSGGNQQSWLFTAIQDPDVLDHINELVISGFEDYIPDDDYPGKISAISASKNPGYHFFYHAPTLIIASNQPNYENAMADCALALENIFLIAQALGLGSCYINQLYWLRNNAPLRDYLAEVGVPREHVICSSAAVGHIEKQSSTPKRKPGTVKIVR
jgi:nitroreductase